MSTADPTPDRIEVREALLTAAAELLAERGPDAISGRDIANRAGVNYGLLHHYFGPKAEVLSAAMDRLRADFIAEFIESRDGDRLAPILDLPQPLIRAVTFSELSNSGVLKPNDDFPVLRRQLAVVADRLDSHPDDPEVQARTAVWVAAQLGWVVFEELLTKGLMGDGDRDEVRRRVAEIVASLVSDPAAETGTGAGERSGSP